MSKGTTSRCLAALAIIVSFFATDLHAQWQRLETLEGIDVEAFATVADGTLYAVAQPHGGLYYSIDGGDTWTRRDDLDSLDFEQLDTIGMDLYAVATLFPGWEKRLFRLPSPTADPEEIELPIHTALNHFGIDNEGNLYATFTAISQRDDFFRSTDRGDTWTFYQTSFVEAISLESIHPVAQGRIWATSRNMIGVCDTSHGEWVTWQNREAITGPGRPIVPLPDGSALISMRDGLFRFSPDDGNATLLLGSEDTLTAAAPGLLQTMDGRLLAAIPISESVQVLSDVFMLHPVRSTLYESLNLGATWSVVDTSFPGVFRLVGATQGAVFAATDANILRSLDGAHTFSDASRGLISANIVHFETREQKLHLEGARYALSADAGATWNYRGPNLRVNQRGLQVTADGVFYENLGFLRISRDSARTWERPFPFATEHGLNDILALDAVVMASMEDATLRRSTDQGRTWQTTYNGAQWIGNLRFDGINIVCTEGSSLLRSTDLGETWQSVALPTSDRVLLAASPRGIIAAAEERLWITRDAGDTWIPLPDIPITYSLTRLEMDRNGNVALLTSGAPFRPDREVLMSTDEGNSWRDISAGLPRVFTSGASIIPGPADIRFSRDRLFVNVAGRGLYAYHGVPTGLGLRPDAPNATTLSVWPTVGTTEFQVRIESPRDARLIVTAVSGAVMYEAPVSAGVASIHLDVRTWPAGSYVLRAGDVSRMAVIVR